jgi:hypothetical protein
MNSEENAMEMRRIMTKWVPLIAVLVSGLATAGTVSLQPSGEYAQVDTRLTNQAIQLLVKGTREDKAKVIAGIESAPDRYAPPAFYVLSNVLFQSGAKDDGAFWFYAGQLRARYDANRCADPTAEDEVAALNQEYGTPINQYTFKHLSMLESLIPKVIEFDRKTLHNYDQRWINLHGMNAVMNGLAAPASKQAPLSLPEDQWDAIAEKTRSDYLAGFKEALAQMRAMQARSK